MEESSDPEHEWPALDELFGTERLAALLGISPLNARRYRSGVRRTPNRLAARIHFLATVIGDLAGAYNDIGIRRWFERRRSLLDDKAPIDFLQGDWSPETPGPLRLKELAHSLAAGSSFPD